MDVKIITMWEGRGGSECEAEELTDYPAPNKEGVGVRQRYIPYAAACHVRGVSGEEVIERRMCALVLVRRSRPSTAPAVRGLCCT